MNATIAICTRNRCEPLEKTLANLVARGVPAQGAGEVLVIDNGSTDATPEVVRKHAGALPIRYLREPRPGVAFARNRALEEFRGDCLVYLDDDVMVSRDWLPALLAPVRSGDYDGALGYVRFPEHIAALALPRQLAYYYAWVDEGVFENGVARWVVSANLCIARRALAPGLRFDVELGPGRMGFCEDILFGKQLATLGRRIAGAPEAWVEHWFDVGRLSDASACASAWKMGASDAYIAHHWMHHTESMIPARLARLYARRAVFKLFQNRRQPGSALSACLPGLCVNYRFEGYLRAMRRLRGQPHYYARQGIRKEGGQLWEAAAPGERA